MSGRSCLPKVALAALFLTCSSCASTSQRAATLAYDNMLAAAEKLAKAGRFADAEPLYRQALAQAQKSPGKRHGREVIASRELGINLKSQGRFVDAEGLLRAALTLAEASFGENSLEVAESISALADVLGSQERHAEVEPLDRKVLAIRRQRLGEDHWKTGVATARLAGTLGQLTRFDEAEKLYRSALTVLDKAKEADPVEVAAAENNFAYLLNAQGRYADAEPHYRAALQLWRSKLGDVHPLVASGFNNVASNLGDQGRFREAEPLYRKALEISISTLGENHPQVAARYNNLGDTLAQLGQPKSALEMQRKAYAIWRSSLGNDHPFVAIGASNVASSLMDEGKIEEAEPLLREAYRIELNAYGAENPTTATTMNVLAELLARLGRRDEALKLRKEALAIRIRTLGKSHRDTASNEIDLANLLSDLDRAQEAEETALDAVEAARRARKLIAGSSSLEVAKAANADKDVLDPVFAGYLTLAFALPDDDPERTTRIKSQAFLAAQDLLGVAPSRDMAQAAVRRNIKDARLGTLVRRQQDLVAEVQSTDSDLLGALSKGDSAKANSLKANYDRTVAELAGLDEQLDREFPRYRELVMPPSLTLDQAKAALAGDEGLLLITAFGPNLHIFAVTKSGGWWVADSTAEEILNMTTRVRCDVDELSCPHKLKREIERERAFQSTDDRPFDFDAAHKIYSALVGPFEEEFRNVKRLYVVSTANLSDLPLELLVMAKPRGSGRPQDMKWLSDRFAFTYLPSVSALRLVEQAGARGGNFLGYGDPVLHGDQSAIETRGFTRAAERGGAIADVAQLKRLEPLPGTRLELEAMRGLFSGGAASIKLGSEATETDLRHDAQLAKADVLTFATHALLPDPAGFDEPGLVLTPPDNPSSEDDGLLSASEVAELSLGAQWVILSACNTASPGQSGGAGGLSALSRAFLYAGARSLLASHWRVSDETTAVLTVETLRYWKSDPGITRAQALQQAMRAVRTGKREDGSRIAGWTPDWAHPAAWAPFTHIANHDD